MERRHDITIDDLYLNGSAEMDAVIADPGLLALMAMQEPPLPIKSIKDASDLQPEDILYYALNLNFRKALQNLCAHIEKREDRLMVYAAFLRELDAAYIRADSDNGDVRKQAGSLEDALMVGMFNRGNKVLNDAAIMCARNYIAFQILEYHPEIRAQISKSVWQKMADDLELELSQFGIDPEIAFAYAALHAPAHCDAVVAHIINLGKATGPSASSGPADPSAG